MRLEQAAGMPGSDIRLMVEVVQETRRKLQLLGLDPHDTTGPELYRALHIRLQEDEQRIRDALAVPPNADAVTVLGAVQQYINGIKLPTHSFVIKQAVVRAILKKLQPKATMKQLGYRSLDSMIKHEPAAQLLAAANMIESPEWHKRRLEAYRKLGPQDFESKKATVLLPQTRHWPKLALEHTERAKHNIITVPEMGTIVLLPLDHDLPALGITSLLLIVESINGIRALGSYLKLQQVRPDYGERFVSAVTTEPMTEAEIGGQLLPWAVVQWFYGHGHSPYYPDVFEPHVQVEDLTWHSGEDLLASLHPALEFWQGSELLALLDGDQAVSLNMLDVALGVCNGLQYGERALHHMRTHLGKELLARYLHHDNLHEVLLGGLDAQLAPEIAFD